MSRYSGHLDTDTLPRADSEEDIDDLVNWTTSLDYNKLAELLGNDPMERLLFLVMYRTGSHLLQQLAQKVNKFASKKRRNAFYS